ncbi:hypothetical protein [Megalodesulfovibrio paquesii]
MNPSDLLVLRQYARVAHHIPGRLRLVFDPAIQKHPSFSTLRDSVELLAGIKHTRVNIMAKTMVLEYATDIISFELLQAVFAEQSSDEHVLACALQLVSPGEQRCVQ